MQDTGSQERLHYCDWEAPGPPAGYPVALMLGLRAQPRGRRPLQAPPAHLGPQVLLFPLQLHPVQQPDLLLLLLQLHLLCDHLELFLVHVGLQGADLGWSSGAQGGALHIFRLRPPTRRPPTSLSLLPQAVLPLLPTSSPRPLPMWFPLPGAPSPPSLLLPPSQGSYGVEPAQIPLADAHRSDVA